MPRHAIVRVALWYRRSQTDKRTFCWRVWLVSCTCHWVVTSSWFNKADCRLSLCSRSMAKPADWSVPLFCDQQLCCVGWCLYVCKHARGAGQGCVCVFSCVYWAGADITVDCTPSTAEHQGGCLSELGRINGRKKECKSSSSLLSFSYCSRFVSQCTRM